MVIIELGGLHCEVEQYLYEVIIVPQVVFPEPPRIEVFMVRQFHQGLINKLQESQEGLEYTHMVLAHLIATRPHLTNIQEELGLVEQNILQMDIPQHILTLHIIEPRLVLLVNPPMYLVIDCMSGCSSA